MNPGTRRTEEFGVLVVTPAGTCDPAVAIAASRAGALGLLDLTCARDAGAASEAVSRMARHARGECGVKICGRSEGLWAGLLPQLDGTVKTALLTFPADARDLPRQVRALQASGLSVLVETTDVEAALAASEAGADGLVAKGNESGGWVGEETTFILLQRLLSRVELPVYAQGGVGLHTAGACRVAGAAGVVLDSQVLLARESALPEPLRSRVARMEGGETVCLGATAAGGTFRAYARPGAGVVESLQKISRALDAAAVSSDASEEWRREVEARVGYDDLDNKICPLGQDAAFAAALAKRFRTVGGIVAAVRESAEEHARTASALKPLGAGSPLAVSHGTTYPIVQGPMTRVSDTASFAREVASGGALPFLALALMRAKEVRRLLEETRKSLGAMPWGVGILGFVPPELRAEQTELVLEYRPPFALIAGGRPDQALALENAGVKTYLHVPSPGLLKQFIESGARRFVLEGRECGGHVGPRSSFVLWEMMTDVLLSSLSPEEASDCHVLLAGGIHDAASASMASAVVAPLAARGVKVGALLGTAYLFTREAVASGAIVEGFQREAVKCSATVLVESGPGHAARCSAGTPFVETFEREKRKLLAAERTPDEVRDALDQLNVGRLRAASKAIERHPAYGKDPEAPRFVGLTEEQQHTRGMFMIGQVAALRDRVCTVEELHKQVSAESSERLAEFAEKAIVVPRADEGAKPCDVAIIGMACMMPKAPTLGRFWENILNKVDAITEIPAHRWDWREYYDTDRDARDKVNSKWGGFLEEITFDPLRYGIPPSTIPSIEPTQLLVLETVGAALEDAGYLERPFERKRASVVFGMGGGAGDLNQKYSFRASLPELLKENRPDLLSTLPEWTSDSFAGTLMSVGAGRVANRFDFGGVNYTVDAACASSLAALHIATRELETGASDMVVVGGVDTDQCPLAYLGFSKTHTFSKSGRCRTFDETADGIVISEGVAVLVLKRLADAERDGDRIYAVIKGVGASSDGRDKSLTAPRPEGQALALERAYAKAGVSPSTVGLVEAHGTGTVAGDSAETETLKRVFEAAGAKRQACAIGSVKSMVGHTKRAAGATALIKVAKALYHKVLPPTMHVERPNPKIGFDESPFYINTEARPWVHATDGPRRAGLSAFGFGGTNFHAVVEEYAGEFTDAHAEAPSSEWPAELFLLPARSRTELSDALASFERTLDSNEGATLRDAACALWRKSKEESGAKLAVVASSTDDLKKKLARVRAALDAGGPLSIKDPSGVYLAGEPLASGGGKVAFLFPGQGSQYAGMLADLALRFPEVREQFESADRALEGKLGRTLSSFVFPRPSFNDDERAARERELTDTRVAQPALGACAVAMSRLLGALGVEAEMAAGHSYGEYAALCAAGAIDEETLYLLSEARGRAIAEASDEEPGAMAAVMERAERVSDLLKNVEGVWVANLNAPTQTVISGTRDGIALAVERLTAEGIQARPVPVACAFHTPLVAGAKARFAVALDAASVNPPRLQVFSNSTAAPYPEDASAITELLAEHLVSPVRFAEEIERMYDAGARIFVEVGPRGVLTGLTGQILGERPHAAVASDSTARTGVTQLLHALAQLAAHGVGVKLDRLFKGRAGLEAPAKKETSRAAWLVDGGRARPAREAAASAQKPKAATVVAQARPASLKTTTERIPKMDKQASARPSNGNGNGHNGNGNGHNGNGHNGNGNGHAVTFPAPPAHFAQDGEAAQVIAEFQRLMNRFLETQQRVMLAYLQGAGGKAEPDFGQTFADAFAPTPTPQANAYTLPEPAASLPYFNTATPATLTVNVPEPSRAYDVRPVAESSSAPQASSPSLTSQTNDVVAETATVSEAQDASGPESLAAALVEIVSDRTGYPPDMLDLDVNMEADLGIDSIKHVEIIGALRKSFAPEYQQRVQERMESLVKAKTLRAILELLEAAGDAAGAKKKLNG